MNELLSTLRSDLLSRRLLPFVALALLVLVVAVGYALAGAGSGPVPHATAPVTAPSQSPALAVAAAAPNPNAAESETTGGLRYQAGGPTRNPFTPLPSPSAPKSAGTTSASGSSPGSSSTGSSPGGAGASSGGTGAQPAPTPPAPPLPKPKPIHAGLAATQSYGVALALTRADGGLNTIDPLERLSVLPSEQQPLLVYLGVLQGGRDALFVVQPGTVVSGPGTCIPGPTDCEILSLAQEQIESLSVSTGTGASNVALFAVTAINLEEHASVAAANRARREASAAGRALLDASTLPALPLFKYQPDVGAVVDLRNLAAGGK